MSTVEVLRRLETRAHTAENIIKSLKVQVQELKKISEQQGCQYKVKQLEAENEVLRKEIEEWKQRLITLECQNGVKQVSLPHEAVSAPKSVPAPEVKPVSVSINKPEVVSAIEKPAKAEKQGKAKAKAERKSAAESAPPAEGKKKQQQPPEDVPVDVGRLDFRVGRITNAKKHPDADALYVEEVDLGEEKPRTVVSGLVAYVPVEQLQNRLVVLLCNLKPVKMRGVTSEAMVMCASTPEKVEVLIPPNGSVPGDIVAFDGYERRPDAVLNPKKKIFETVAPDLKTDAKKVATYKGVPFTVPGKGVVTAPSLTNVQIK